MAIAGLFALGAALAPLFASGCRSCTDESRPTRALDAAARGDGGPHAYVYDASSLDQMKRRMPCRVMKVRGEAWATEDSAGDAGARTPLRPHQTLAIGSTIELGKDATLDLASPRGGRKWTVHGPARARVCEPETDAMLLVEGVVDVHGTSATSSDHRFDITTPQAAVRVSIGGVTVSAAGEKTRVVAHAAQLTIYEAAGAKRDLSGDAGTRPIHGAASWRRVHGDATITVELAGSKAEIQKRISACESAQGDEQEARTLLRDRKKMLGAPAAMFEAHARVMGACAVAESAILALPPSKGRAAWLERLQAALALGADAGAPDAPGPEKDAG